MHGIATTIVRVLVLHLVARIETSTRPEAEIKAVCSAIGILSANVFEQQVALRGRVGACKVVADALEKLVS